MYVHVFIVQINYMEKMGKRSPFLTGKYKRPSLRDWDVKTANQDLQKVHDLMWLEHGLTAGVTRLYNTDEGPLVLCFDADTCPLSKVREKQWYNYLSCNYPSSIVKWFYIIISIVKLDILMISNIILCFYGVENPNSTYT